MSTRSRPKTPSIEGWLRTGDICRIDADGFVYIMGRAKDVIIRGGHNIDPRAIEDAALGFPGVALAAAVGRPDAYAGEVPMLFVSTQPGVHIDPQALSAFVLEKILEPPARPRAVSVIAEMPVTPIGKIFKPKLREIAAGEAARELLAAEGLATTSASRRSPIPRAGCFCASRRRPTRPSPRNGCCKSFRSRSSLRLEIPLIVAVAVTGIT